MEIKMRIRFLLLGVLFSALMSMQAFTQDLLKSSDVDRIMKQILTQHLGDKEMTVKVLQTSIINFLEQFDTNRMYLLDSEVQPYMNLSQAELQQILDQYQHNNFAIFDKLNKLIQQSILRSRRLRKEIENNAINNLFNAPTSKHENQNFPANLDDLKKRIIENLESFIQTQKMRYGEPNTKQRKEFLLHTYEERLQETENQYLFEDDKGQPLSKPEQENLFTIHILKALASSLDSHTSFYQANEAYDIRLHLQKEFQGIGITFRETPNGTLVTSIIPGGPAAKSGLINVDDVLLTIDGQAIAGLPFEKIMDMLHEDSKPEVKLTFKHPASDNKPERNYSVSLKRDVIIINNDRVDVKEEKFGNGIIGIIKLHSFYQGNDISSEKDVRKAIDQLEKNGNLKGLILDLRDNRGGFLSQAIKVAGLFITNGVVVISKYADGEEHFYRDVDGKVAYDGPLVVLTSKITASAAEIVAQALQDYGVAIIVGDDHTYGKGTIQTQTVTDNRSSSYFKVTVGKYYTVSGKTPQKEGVKSDIVVPSHWNKVEVGEQYADTVDGDKIPPSYNDGLADIKDELKSWYLKYYTPKLQHRTSEWRDLLPTLKKNSSFRIANNKNYQFFINGPIPDVDEDEESDIKSGGEDDLQLGEAVNIVKDMYFLHSAGKN